MELFLDDDPEYLDELLLDDDPEYLDELLLDDDPEYLDVVPDDFLYISDVLLVVDFDVLLLPDELLSDALLLSDVLLPDVLLLEALRGGSFSMGLP